MSCLPCQVCHDLVKEKNNAPRLYLEFTPESLNHSALVQRCRSCDFLMRGILLMQDDTWSFIANVSRVYGYGLATEMDTLTLEVYFIDERPRMMLEFFCVDRDGEFISLFQVLSEIHRSFRLTVLDCSNMPWKAIRTRTGLNGHPLGPKAITWVNSMLNLCAGGHEICPPVARSPFPKRILALERRSGPETLVKVVEKESAQGIYAALSHCWGLDLPCVTTVGNRADRLRGIPWTELPQTFQDAIQYCLELGIFYLWIDALCILQDDREDWQIESAKMADIYQNSYLTLAATSSESGSMGCFSKQSISYQDRQLEVQSTEGQVYRIMVRRQMPHWVVPPTLLSRRENPLLSRGWAFQERVLSPRVLHFCKQELVWECGQDTVCECGSLPKVQNLKRRFALAARLRGADDVTQDENQGDRSEPNRRHRGRQSGESYQQGDLSDSDSLDEALRSVYLGPKKLARLEAERAKKRLDKATDQWHSIVEQFSALELTKDTDRLPALSGLAERMSPFLGRYLTGLWQESLLRDLGWRVDKLLSGLQKSEKGRGHRGPGSLPERRWHSGQKKKLHQTKPQWSLGLGYLQVSGQLL